VTFTQALARQSLQYPIKIKVMKEPEIRAYHLKKHYKLSLNSIGEIPQLNEPIDEQKEWVLFRLRQCNTWPKLHENKIGDFKNWR
jgi:hypothetical protein